jgi:hypothetical protein
MRAEAIASAQNNGQVDLPADAPWAEAFVREMEEFPLSEHDDCVDAYTWAQAGFVRGEGFFKVPELPPEITNYDAVAEYKSQYQSPLDRWEVDDEDPLNPHGVSTW